MNFSGVSSDDLRILKVDGDRAFLNEEGVAQFAARGHFTARVIFAREKAKNDAIKNLARYKFSNFGYHAARWVTLNALIGDRQPNPFRALVDLSKTMLKQP